MNNVYKHVIGRPEGKRSLGRIDIDGEIVKNVS
jgi:hypothetical protein